MSVKLRAIARICKVDASTVSRALRDDARVNVRTRARVREAAERLGYQPNLTARSLVAGRSRTVWFILHTLEFDLDRGAVQAASRYLAARDYDLVVAMHQGDAPAYRRLMGRLTQGVADGALVVPRSLPDAGLLHPLALQGYPLVFLDLHVEGLPFPVVTSDNAAAARGLVQRCRAAGAREFVVLFHDGNPVERDRLRGTLEALGEQRCAYQRLADPASAWRPAASSPGPVGVVATSQRILATFAAAHADALCATPPVFGCFDSWYGEPNPAATVFVAVQDFDAMARTAADLVVAMIGSRTLPSARMTRIAPLEFRVIPRRF
jgi:DNA-binding LacI/PurR family transcriptional regulator